MSSKEVPLEVTGKIVEKLIELRLSRVENTPEQLIQMTAEAFSTIYKAVYDSTKYDPEGLGNLSI